MSEEKNDEKFIFVSFENLWKLEYDVFKGMGIPDADAKICADILFEADKKGIDSHGVGRLFMYYVRIKKNQQNPITNVTIDREMPATARLNAHNGMGQVVSHKAMQMAIDKAKKYGIGMVTVGESNHYGIAGYYALMASEQGCIGMSGTNARPSIAPTWGVQPMIGTNPLTIALPTDWNFAWFADHATSIIQRGKVEMYARLNKPVMKGWVISSKGEMMTDPKKILSDMLKSEASLAPIGGFGEEFGGYKGYNYATFVEIMSAALCSANHLTSCFGFEIHDGKQVTVPFRLGHFFIAINIEAFMDLKEFKKTTGDILRELANSRLQPGAKHIYVAGEKEFITENERREKGIPISEATQLQMQEMFSELKLDPNNYEIEWSVKSVSKADTQGW